LGKHAQHEHPADALLHAFVAGEVDPAQRAAISQHLESCAQCREAKARVEAVTGLFPKMQPLDLDEMRWRRISQGVMSHLENEGLQHRHWSIANAFFRPGWAALGVAALVAIVVVVWIAPRSISVLSPAAKVEKKREGGVSTIVTGQTALALTLPPGVSLRLSPNARVVARSTVPPQIALDLDFGTLEIVEPETAPPNEAITIRTPDFITTAQRSDFTIGFESDRFFVRVRRGEATVEGDALEKAKTVRAKDALVLAREGSTWREEAKPTAEVVPPARLPPSIERRRAAGLVKPKVHEEETPPPPVSMKSQPPADENVHSSYEGVTKVEVEAPPEDVIAKKWHDASFAYYKKNDVRRAVALANDIVAGGGEREEVLLALDLLCEAHLHLQQPKRALEACEARLERETDPEAIRAANYRIANIERQQLHDCRGAMDHYSKAMVFGRNSLLDNDALVWRASCALDLGDLDAAKRDIALLDARSALLARPGELAELKDRLAALSAKQKTK
jgi:hypothetical protein